MDAAPAPAPTQNPCLHAHQFSESTLPRKECVTSSPHDQLKKNHVSKRCIQSPELSLPRKECVTSQLERVQVLGRAGEEYLNQLGVRQIIIPSPPYTMQSANNTFSTDPYFAPLENAAYGPSTVPLQQFPNPPPVESFDLSWSSPPPATNLLYNTPFPNLFPLHPFETPWFAESAASQFPPLDNNQHGCSFQPVPLPSASSTGSSAETHITPTRRVRNGKRRGEETPVPLPSASSTDSSAEIHITPTRRVRNGKR